MTQVEVRHIKNLQHQATSGAHSITIDEPAAIGGGDTGMTPYELLLSALGGCIALTLRLYARRKGWALEGVRVELTHDKVHATDCDDCEGKEGVLDVIRKSIELTGDLSTEQVARLREIAARCPVHRTLTGYIEILDDSAPGV